jgi:hypothetical protein
MVYRDVNCPICKEPLGRAHMGNTSHTIENHVYEKHRDIWKEIHDTVREMTALNHKISDLGKKIYDKYGILIGIYRDSYLGEPKK